MDISIKTEVQITMNRFEAKSIEKLIGNMPPRDMKNYGISEAEVDFLVDVFYQGIRDTLET